MRTSAIVLTVFLTAGAGTAQAETFGLSQTVANPNPDNGDLFGSSVASFGPYVLVGAPRDDAAGADAGAAYLYRLVGGLLTLERTFVPTGAAAGSEFGTSVTGVPNGAGGYNAVIGAWLDDTGAHDAGAAYLFDAQTGALLSKVTDPTPAPLDYFGAAVAALGNDFLVGAANDTDATGLPHAGAFYRFDGLTGTLVRTYGNPQPRYSPAADDKFGQPLAAFLGNILAGAYDGGAGASASTRPGYAHLVDASTGARLATFQQPAEHTGNAFHIVAGFGERVAVGAWGDDFGADAAGSVYVFDPDATLRIPIRNPSPAGSDSFGSSVAAFRSFLLVGARLDDATATNSGATFVFDGRTGGLVQSITPPVAAYQATFGHAVAAMGSRFLVGAPSAAGGTGSVYLYRAGCTVENVDEAFERLLAIISSFDPTPGTGDLSGPTEQANRGRRQALLNRTEAARRHYVNSGGRGNVTAQLKALRAEADEARRDRIVGQGAYLFTAQIDLLLDIIVCN